MGDKLFPILSSEVDFVATTGDYRHRIMQSNSAQDYYTIVNTSGNENAEIGEIFIERFCHYTAIPVEYQAVEGIYYFKYYGSGSLTLHKGADQNSLHSPSPAYLSDRSGYRLTRNSASSPYTFISECYASVNISPLDGEFVKVSPN